MHSPRQGSTTNPLPALNGRVPFGAEHSRRKRGVAVSGGEFRRGTAFIGEYPTGHTSPVVGQRDVEAVVVDPGPGRVGPEQHRRCQQNRVVEVSRQLTDVEFGALPVDAR
jgi:hypothetical protein